MDAGSDDRTQPVDGLQVLQGGGLQTVQVTEGGRHQVGHRRAHVRDAQPEEQSPQGSCPGILHSTAEVVDRRLAEPVHGRYPVVVQGEHPGHVVQEALADEEVDPLLAEALDVHCPTRCEVLYASPDLPGAGVVRTERGRLALGTGERFATFRTRRREGPDGQSPGPLGQDGTQHLRDDIASLAYHHHVTGADVLLANLVGIVEGGGRNRGSAHEHRLETGEGGGLASGSDGHLNVEQARGALLRRELEGNGPTWCPGGEPQSILQPEVVDLDDHPVDLVVEVVARRSHPVDMVDDVLEVGEALHPLVHREAEGGQPGQGVAMRAQLGPAHHLAQLVGPEREVPGGGHRSVLLPQRTGCRVAGVHVLLLASCHLGEVQRSEGRESHVDLTADLHNRRGALGQAGGHVADGPDVGRDVLAGPTITPGGSLDQQAVHVAEGHGEAVELQLAGPRRGGRTVSGIAPEAAKDPFGPCAQLVDIEGVVQRTHGNPVDHLVEGGPSWDADPERGGIVGGQVRVLGLQGPELHHECVVVGVRDLRIILGVVTVEMEAD